MRIGLISDTHGKLRPEALDALAGADVILHAGDIGSPDVLAGLARIAPVHAVRGNNDTAAWAAGIPESLRLSFAGVEVFVVHEVAHALSTRVGGPELGRLVRTDLGRPSSGPVRTTAPTEPGSADVVSCALTRVVVSGHSHRPSVEERDGTLWVNPGSAGPRRFRLPVTVGWLLVGDGGIRAEIVPIV